MSNTESVSSNFIRQAIDSDLQSGSLAGRRWSGAPGIAAVQRLGPPDPAAIRTRFPPEPNGYLHIGHAKSICLNFGIAQSYGGRCHMRFDDTNPAKEEQEYVDSILDSIHWLGFSWDHPDGQSDLYFASDYFERLYDFACFLIGAGHAYVDEQSADGIREGRGTLTEPGQDSPFRDRAVQESLDRFREMRAGDHAEGTMVLRARIDMRSPNMNLRDPVLYRIRFVHHHRTGDRWSVYPMYDYAHPLSDALECITHSLCTLEFEDHRPLYDWLIARVAEGGYFDAPLPRQIEFARLNLNYTVTSKRRLQQLVAEGHVDGWDDPRMTTLVGLRRRGYTPESIRLFCDRIGVAKAAQWIDMGVLEQAVRDDLEARAGRVSVAVDPLKLVITSLDAGASEPCEAPVHPHHPERGVRRFHLGRELWIEREDFSEDPPKGFFRLAPDRMVRLRYGYVVKCTGLRSRRGRQGLDRVLRAPARHPLRHARRGLGQGQGEHPLGECGRGGGSGTADLRPALHRSPAGCRRPRLHCRLESGVEADLHRLRRAFDSRRPARTAPAVRAARLLRCRPPRPPRRATGVQPGRHAQGLLRQAGLRAKSQGPGARIQRLAASG